MSVLKFFCSKETLVQGYIEEVESDFHCEDVGICTFSKYHDFEYNHVSLNDGVDWERLVFITFRLTLFSLIAKKALKIKYEEIEESYLGGFINLKRRYFFLEPSDGALIKDILSSKVLNVFNELYFQKNSKVHLHEMITSLFNSFTGYSETYLLPCKRILLKILDLYVKQFKWLDFEEDYHLLGTHYKYRVSIEPIYIPRLKLQHDSIASSYNNSLKTNVPLRQFVRRIEEVLEFNYGIRKTFSGTKTARGGHHIEFQVPVE